MTYLKSFEFPDSAGFQVVAGRSDGLQRLMVVSGRLPRRQRRRSGARPSR